MLPDGGIQLARRRNTMKPQARSAISLFNKCCTQTNFALRCVPGFQETKDCSVSGKDAFNAHESFKPEVRFQLRKHREIQSQDKFLKALNSSIFLGEIFKK